MKRIHFGNNRDSERKSIKNAPPVSSRLENTNPAMSTPPRRRSLKKKINNEDLPPAGMSSLERIKNTDYHIKFVNVQPNALAAGVPSHIPKPSF